jgi:molybdenum cofactor cytidylyltransferase
MRFEAIPIAEAAGAVLGHNIPREDGRRLLRKGRILSQDDLAVLRASGRATVWVARLDADDVEENRAARQIAAAASGAGVQVSGASTGRVNLSAAHAGVLRVDVARLEALNGHQGVTLATLRHQTAVAAGKMLATLKILPYALPRTTVCAAAHVASGLVTVAPPRIRRIGLVISGSAASRERTELGFRNALGARLAVFGAAIERRDFVALDGDDAVARLAQVLRDQREAGMELVILAGETAIMDDHDIAPRAIERAGGAVACFGAPVDPGNLLLLAYAGDTAIVGAPGCARSPKTNVIDHVLPRLLVGDRLGRADLIALAHGGLLEDVPERRMPRSWVT